MSNPLLDVAARMRVEEQRREDERITKLMDAEWAAEAMLALSHSPSSPVEPVLPHATDSFVSRIDSSRVR